MHLEGNYEDKYYIMKLSVKRQIKKDKLDAFPVFKAGHLYEI